MQNLKKVYETNTKHILGSDLVSFKNLREKLIEYFVFSGNKIKNNESVKFIDPKILNNINFNIKNNKHKSKFLSKGDTNLSSIIVKNGFDYILTNFDEEKVKIEPLSEDLNLLIKNIEKNNLQFEADYIVNLNSILLNSGFNFTLNENTNYKTTLTHENTESNNTFYTRNFFHIKANSKLILIENFMNTTSSNTNIFNCFELEENSEVVHLVIQNNKESSSLQFTSNTTCHKNSNFNQFVFNSSESSIRNHHYASLLGEYSEVNLKGIFFGGNNQIIDNKTQINHFNHSCISNQIYKGVLKGNAKASYLSKTFVDKIAQKTDGYQLSKGILLSDEASFFSKPELKIYADDVKCSHGSTIGPFDKDEIFYLRSRGIDEKNAKFLLINSFCKDLLITLSDEIYLNTINTLIDKWLLKNVT